MTYTRTFTLEERALEALTSQRLIKVRETGVVGHVTAVRVGHDPDGLPRLMDVTGLDDTVHEVELSYDAWDWA
jgi:hypothetical protein